MPVDHKVRFGVGLEAGVDQVSEMLRHARPADDAGLDFVSVGDHPYVPAVIYRDFVLPQFDSRSHGRAFDEIVEDYDRHRPTYPDALVDRACAGLSPGAAVLEIGCGTGQLTRSLLVRGLRVTAVEPGRQLIARARDRCDGAGAGDVEFVNARLEDAPLPRAHYAAVFSASAIHWVDPDLSWRIAAEALVDGGSLALLSYFGLDDPRSAEDQHALRAVITRIAPEAAASWPIYRDLADTLAGVQARREDVSEIWAWLGGYDVARAHAQDLFEEARLATVSMQLEHTADELNALLGTMSFWAGLTARQRHALVAENQSLYQRLGRPIRSSTAACLVVARRRPST